MPSFAFVSALVVNYTSSLDARGMHFVIPAEAPAPMVVWGCGIKGELLPVDFAVPEKPVVRMGSAVLGPALYQARSLKWVGGHLLVADRDLLFWNTSAGAGERPTLEQNLSWAQASGVGDVDAGAGGGGIAGGTDDAGINGVALVTSPAGETMLVGATMHSMKLVTATPMGAGWEASETYGMDSAMFDVDALLTSTGPLLVAVGPAACEADCPILRVFNITDGRTGRFRPDWRASGVVNRSWAGAKGCNRVRVHQKSRRAVFSCFGGNDLVGFVDLEDHKHPNLTGVIPFVTEQPTGMLVVGDAVLVAGGRDVMVFDMRAPPIRGVPPVVATCGAACAAVAPSAGQNFHSIGYRLEQGRHLIFISAQIDNIIGCVEVVDPKIIDLF